MLAELLAESGRPEEAWSELIAGRDQLSRSESPLYRMFALLTEAMLALRFHRDADPSAARELQNNIRVLSNGEAIQIIRAFGHFSHLANIAEDRATRSR